MSDMLDKCCENCIYRKNGFCTSPMLCVDFSSWGPKEMGEILILAEKRERIAIAAMLGLLSVSDWSYEKVAVDAVIMADNLIKELSK